MHDYEYNRALVFTLRVESLLPSRVIRKANPVPANQPLKQKNL